MSKTKIMKFHEGTRVKMAKAKLVLSFKLLIYCISIVDKKTGVIYFSKVDKYNFMCYMQNATGKEYSMVSIDKSIKELVEIQILKKLDRVKFQLTIL